MCGGSSLYSSNNEYNITLVTDTHFFIKTGTKNSYLGEPAQPLTIYHTHHTSTIHVYKKYIYYFLFLLE